MISGIFLVLPLLAPVQGPLPADQGGEASADAYQDLVDEYKKPSLKWRKKQRAAKKEGKAFDEAHPIERYFGRIEAVAEAGDARALLWVALNVQDTSRTPGEVKTTKRDAFTELVAGHAGDELAADLVKRLGRQDDWLTDEEICGMLERVYAVKEKDAVKGDAAYRLAQRFEARDTADGDALAEKWYRTVVEEFAGSKVAGRAKTRLSVMQIAVGRIAPDFETEDVEGNAFKLSDYRGKVVVLDFWGFW